MKHCKFQIHDKFDNGGNRSYCFCIGKGGNYWRTDFASAHLLTLISVEPSDIPMMRHFSKTPGNMTEHKKNSICTSYKAINKNCLHFLISGDKV